MTYLRMFKATIHASVDSLFVQSVFDFFGDLEALRTVLLYEGDNHVGYSSLQIEDTLRGTPLEVSSSQYKVHVVDHFTVQKN